VDTQVQVLKSSIGVEFDEARVSFRRLLDGMSPDALRRPSDGTKWTNEELLFHMLFGYLIMWALIRIVKIFGHLPVRVSVLFASLLNRLTAPFNLMNYLGPRIGVKIYNHRRMGAKFDRTVASLRRRLAAENERSLRLEMCFPVKWDPFFKDRMTLADVYHYPFQHFEFHGLQLSQG
jgi:hypothetical protein